MFYRFLLISPCLACSFMYYKHIEHDRCTLFCVINPLLIFYLDLFCNCISVENVESLILVIAYYFFTLLFLYFLIQVTCVICYVRFLPWFHIPYFVYELPILFMKVLCMLSRYASSLLHLLVFVYMYALFLIFSWLFHFVLPFSYIIYFFCSWFEWNVCCICYGTLVMIC